MKGISDMQLIEKARKAAKLHKSSEDVRIGDVGCTLVSSKGNVYQGVSIHACCGVGFCAEHSAIAAMALNREYVIKKIVAVSGDGRILPPCGRCRELMYQIDEKNKAARIIIRKNKTAKLSDLLPEHWQAAVC